MVYFTLRMRDHPWHISIRLANIYSILSSINIYPLLNTVLKNRVLQKIADPLNIPAVAQWLEDSPRKREVMGWSPTAFYQRRYGILWTWKPKPHVQVSRSRITFTSRSHMNGIPGHEKQYVITVFWIYEKNLQHPMLQIWSKNHSGKCNKTYQQV